MLVAGLQCSALLLKDTTNLLKRCHSANANYLFQQDKFYDVNLDIGDNGPPEHVNKAFALVRYLMEQMKKREGFHLLGEPEFVAPVIKECMMKRGTMMVGYQPQGNKVNFFHVVVFSPIVTQKDMDFFLNEIESLGKDL
ncbi:hypothetical protein LDENG_00227120 [Lucifuga dentata]|nr:hypothetical protein LDENG_00227120 [Lucifuga dentata]